jgi:hypothetical protein
MYPVEPGLTHQATLVLLTVEVLGTKCTELVTFFVVALLSCVWCTLACMGSCT